ncbi:hypothetical protein DPMN_169624 [Dreissena polymorpha]|uniref:Uncharacterized protein n=1 Tax=Dreissena polymorpha TaxID=45954 RepID=A0A9D4IDJ1_DREPO|nr:hypothetical protein DPMN_169624 [Dreissena polymorpha]
MCLRLLFLGSETGHLTATNIEMREPDGEQEGATGAGDDLMEVSVQPVKPVDTQMVPVSRKLSLIGSKPRVLSKSNTKMSLEMI